MFVNINKLKPYKFIKEKNLQFILVEPIQTKEHVPLPIELKDFQLVRFELVSNHLTLSSIKTTYVFIHHYHNMLNQDNNVIMNNDPNDVFGKALIDAYLLRVFNPKANVHSQPHSHFCMK